LYKKIREIIVKSNEDLKNIGFEEFVLIDFYEIMLEKLDQAAKEDADEDILYKKKKKPNIKNKNK
jgi:hypothetical protein